MEFNKGLLLIVSLSSLLLSVTARGHQNSPAPAPAVAFSVTSLSISPSSIQVMGFQQTAATHHVDPALKSICKDGENPELCAATIAPFMSNGPIDPVKALEVEIAASVNQTKKIAATIAQLLKDRNTPKAAKDALDVCRKSFDDVLDDLKDAVSAFGTKDVGRARTMLGAVITMESTCRDAFAETPGVECPFAADSQTLYQLAGNCLAIFKHIMPSFFF